MKKKFKLTDTYIKLISGHIFVKAYMEHFSWLTIFYSIICGDLNGKEILKRGDIYIYACVHAKSLQSCLTLEHYDYSPPGFSVHGILQARILEWVAVPSARRSSWLREWTSVSCISCFGRWVLYHWVTWEAHGSVYTLMLLSPFSSLLVNSLCWAVETNTTSESNYTPKKVF